MRRETDDLCPDRDAVSRRRFIGKAASSVAVSALLPDTLLGQGQRGGETLVQPKRRRRRV